MVAEKVDFDSVLLAVMANRMDAIVREMTNTLLRAGRSAILTVARDLSCSIVTGDNRLLAAAEGCPVHIIGSEYLSEAMIALHPDLAEGDAFLHNDPYLGNTHSADHTILVPVFVDGQHLFTACAKAHQADCGNSLPTTYMPFARDVYEEGAINFPCVRVQRGYEMEQDIIRMCRRRIRVPDQWYGDFLAGIGAARIAERRLKEMVANYGVTTIQRFIEEWFDYSERRMIDAIKKLPKARFVGEGAHDALPPNVPDSIPIKVIVTVDPKQASIEVDLRDNPDCVPAGLNESRTCSINNATTGVFNSLDDPTIPVNAGSFRRIRIELRENCVVGIPRFPASCSVATNHMGDRLVNITQRAFAELGEGYGLAEGGIGMNPGMGVVSGTDWRRGGAPYVNQMCLCANGGPGSAYADGWITYLLPVGAGMTYRDSVELDELKYPLHVRSMELRMDNGGAGRRRGAPGLRTVYGPKRDPMTVIYPIDGEQNPPRGVRGGLNGGHPMAAKIALDGNEAHLPSVWAEELKPGEFIVSYDCGGAGYGNPHERETERVLADVLEGWVSLSQARELYGVIFTGSIDDESLTVDVPATVTQRALLSSRSLET